MRRSPGCPHRRRWGCGGATGRFTGRDRFEPTTVAAYRETLDALWGHLGEVPVDVTAAQIEEFLQSRWGPLPRPRSTGFVHFSCMPHRKN